MSDLVAGETSRSMWTSFFMSMLWRRRVSIFFMRLKDGIVNGYVIRDYAKLRCDARSEVKRGDTPARA
jgi:hypothetical protein